MSLPALLRKVRPQTVAMCQLGFPPSRPQLVVSRAFSAEQDARFNSFVNSAFDFFDLNRNGIIEYYELDFADKRDSSSELFRLFTKSELAPPCKCCGSSAPAPTAEILADMDLMKAVQDGKIKLRKVNVPSLPEGYDLKEGVITKKAFEQWCRYNMEQFQKGYSMSSGPE